MHTPGPWIVALQEEALDSAWAEGKTDDSFIVRSNESSVGALGETIAAVPDNRPANAFLIAAAPELLEACVTLVGILRLQISITTRAVCDAEAAIAKATGGK